MIATLLFLAAAADTTLHLRVLSVNDFHGQLAPATYAWSRGRPVGGLDGLRRLMDSVEAECACPTLRLDAGDEMQGTLLSNLVAGRSSVEGMNLLGIDVAAVGNHDLDRGQDSLRARQNDARYGWVVANVFDSVTGRRPDWADPYTIVPVAGMRVAVIGYMTRETKQIVSARHVAGLVVRGGIEPLGDVLEDVARADPDFTILLAHAGGFCREDGCTGEILDLARDLPEGRVDLIVSGHTHSLLNTRVNGIPIVQSLSNARALGVSDLTRTPEGTRVTTRVDTVWADAPVSEETRAFLATYEAIAAPLANRVIAILRDTLQRTRGEQYALGNLLADALREVGQADVGLINNGGIRSDLPAGNVTYGQLFQLQPFANRVVRLTLSGRTLRAVLEHAVGDGTPDAHVAGVTVRWDRSRPAGDRVREVRLTDGRRLDPEGTYTLALGDFLHTGGGGYTMLVPLPAEPVNLTDLELTIRYLESRPSPVVVPSDPRFVPVGR